jgi:branched-chain amino acid transport system permease protein
MIEQIVNGLCIGSFYVILALGLVLPFAVFKIPWFTHATMVMLGGFITYSSLFFLGLDLFVAIIISIVGCVVVISVIEKFVMRSLYGIPHFQFFVSIFGFYMIIQYSALAIWGIFPRLPPPFLMRSIEFGPIRISLMFLIVLIVSVFVMLTIFYFLKKTKLGKAIRATSQNSDTANILGINIDRIRLIVFIISGILAGLAGSFLFLLYRVDPFVADYVIMKVFIVMILGGMGSLIGTIIAGFAVGISEVFIVAYVTSAFGDAILFMVVIAFLLIKPTGIYKTERRRT